MSRRVLWNVVRVVLALGCLATIGFLSFLPAVVGAAVERDRRRRTAFAVAAVVIGALTVVGVVMLTSVPDAREDEVLSDDVGFGLVLLGAALGIAAAFLFRRPPDRAQRYEDVADLPGVEDALERRELRARFQELARTDPALAVELGVGRPDRPGSVDDGGLLDLNGLSASELTRFGRLAPEHAASVVAVRTRLGHLRSVDEVVVHGTLDPATAGRLRERAVFLPSA